MSTGYTSISTGSAFQPERPDPQGWAGGKITAMYSSDNKNKQSAKGANAADTAQGNKDDKSTQIAPLIFYTTT